MITVMLFLSACNSDATHNELKDDGTYTKPPLLTPYLKENNLKLIVPLYLYPAPDSLEWEHLIDYKVVNKEIDMVVISNPSNGDFTEVDEHHLKNIQDMNRSHIQVIGYIHTNYGERDIDEVKANIDSWTDIYKDAGVSGIFFDEAPSTDDQNLINYYTDIYNYAKDKGYRFIVINSGTSVDNCYIDNGIADMVISYEKSGATLLSGSDETWTDKGDKTNLGMLVYYMDDDKLAEGIDIAVQHQFDYIYFVDENDRERWNTFSKYLALETPYDDDTFKTLLEHSELHTATKNYTDLTSLANRYFYLQDHLLFFSVDTNIDNNTRSVLDIQNDFYTSSATAQKLIFSAKIASTDENSSFVFADVFSDDTNETLLQFQVKEQQLELLFNGETINLEAQDQEFFEVTISFIDNELSVTFNTDVIVDSKDLTSWENNKIHFRIGTILEGTGRSSIAFEKVEF
jgi:hypothetical protein